MTIFIGGFINGAIFRNQLTEATLLKACLGRHACAPIRSSLVIWSSLFSYSEGCYSFSEMTSDEDSTINHHCCGGWAL